MSSTYDFSSLLGPSLIRGKNEQVPTSTLNGKHVLIYFSAHWCPPCRNFTPMLATFYNQLKGKRDDFDIVFASSDKDEAQFSEYFASMPWLSLPFSERALKEKLSGTYKVRGIPTLVVLGPDGKVVTTAGREKVAQDPTGQQFPWIPETFQQELGDSFLSKTGTVTSAALAGKYVGIYFSAHWCPPCKAFTPKLCKFYTDRKAAGKDDFEIIFASSDKEQSQFDEYYGSMPFFALPFQDPRIGKLASRFEVQGIPMLVIVDSEGRVVNKDSRGRVEADPSGAQFPFYPEPVEDVAESLESWGGSINDTPSLVCFMEGLDDGDQEDAKKVLAGFGTTLAKEKSMATGSPEMLFFYAREPSRMSTVLREKTGNKAVGDAPLLIMFDVTDNGAFYKKEVEEVTEKSVGDFIAAFRAKSLARGQLS